MKTKKIFFWIITILLGAFMIFSALPSPESKTFMAHLGYPQYFTNFISVAKIVGVIAILIPGHWRIKEWAYAGLCFDLVGAVYSLANVEGVQPGLAIMALPLIFLFVSYWLYHQIYPGVRKA